MIDELIHSCIEQIGLDGEAGTEIDRFAHFIRQYHAEHSSRSQLPDQLVDASYQAFVFRQLLGHPDVNVGLFVPGVPVQSGAKKGILKRKSSALDSPASRLNSESSSNPAPPEFDSVELLPDQALAEQDGLAKLQQIHGQRLRLVLQTSTIKRLLVGADDIYLPPSTFRVLQIIFRSREIPVLSTDIGNALHTDQKTVFYICKRLTDINLVTKIKARETGTVASYFVATRFEDRCDILIQQRNAQTAADLQQSNLLLPPASAGVAQACSSSLASTSVDAAVQDNDKDANKAESDQDEDDNVQAEANAAPTVTVRDEDFESQPDSAAHLPALLSAPTFEAVDPARTLVWLNSRPELVRFRIYLICNATPSKVTARVGLLNRLNLTVVGNRKKALLSLLEHAVVDGFLEVVRILVSSTSRTHRGLRMTAKGQAEMHDLLSGDYSDVTMLQEQVKAVRLNAHLQQDLNRLEPTLPREVTFERHFHEQIARAGPAGHTIRQLMAQLHATGHFARTIEQAAQRSEDADGEPSLSDLRARTFYEHKLRVRSTKFFSYHAWVLQSANEGILDPQDLQLLASAGGSTSYHRKSTSWTTSEQVGHHLTELGKDLFTPTPGKGAKKIGRPPKKRDSDSDSDVPPRKRGRPRKHPLPGPDEPPTTRGRPRKHPLPDPDSPVVDTPPAKRGRPRKNPLPDPDSSTVDTPRRKRTRTGKQPVEPADAKSAASSPAPSPAPSSSSRRLQPADMDQDAALIGSTVQGDDERSPGEDPMDEDFVPAFPDSPAAGAASRRSRRLAGGDQTRTSSLLSSSAPTADCAGEPAALQSELVDVPQSSIASDSPATVAVKEQDAPQAAVRSESAVLAEISQDTVQSEHVVPEMHAEAPAPPQDGVQSELATEERPSQDVGQSEHAEKAALSQVIMQEKHVLQASQDLRAAPVNVSRVEDLIAAHPEVKAEAQSVLPATPAVKKRAKATATPSASERKQRTNLTQLRSATALVRCIQEAGGAMDALLIPDLLTDYVEKHGFASDAQLSDLRDRKVREKALAAAVDSNMLRRTFIRLDLPTAFQPRRQILCLPDLPADQLQAYCEGVKQGRLGWTGAKNMNTALNKATDNVAIASIETLRFTKPWHVDDPFPLADLPADHSQLSMLRQPFRDVISVYRQHIGFLGGEMLRLKAFHHACAKFIPLRGEASPERDDAASLPLSFFWTDAPLDLFLGLVATPPLTEDGERRLLDPRLRTTPVRDLPDEVKASLGLSNRIADDVCVSVYSMATQLADLGIVRLQAGDAAQPSNVSRLDMSNVVVEPLGRLPLYNWASEGPQKPLIGFIEAGLDVDQINRFWAKMQVICLARRRMEDDGEILVDVPAADAASAPFGSGALSVAETHKTVAEELASLMHTPKPWRPFNQLRPSQVKFLYRIDLRDIPSATPADIDRLAYVTLAPQEVVRAVFQTRLLRTDETSGPDAPTTRRGRPRFTWPLRLSTITLPTSVYDPVEVKSAARTAKSRGDPSTDTQKRNKTQVERERQGRLTTLTKARQLRQRREQEFQGMLEYAFHESPAAHDLRAKIETALKMIRRKFIAGDVRFDANAVQIAIARAIRSASGLRTMPAVRAPSGSRRRRRADPAPTEPTPDSDGEPGQAPGQKQQADGDDETGKAGKRDRRARKLDQVNFWTPAKKELLRDAAVILRVRDQVRGRSDWSALFQIIDRDEFHATRGVVMAQWRGQYYRMRSLHGEESYLAALESRWIPVYLAAREAGTLQDDDFPAATGFDLAAQIQLLRKSIDKDEVQRSLTKPVAKHHLPLELDAESDFTTNWKDEFAQEPVERRFEAFFAGDLGVATKRFETLLFTAFGDEDDDSGDRVGANVDDLMAEWAVRIVIASAGSDTGAAELDESETDTPTADEAIKAEFCSAVGDARIEAAMQRLLDAKLIRSITVDPGTRRRPGTNFVFTEELNKLLPDPNAANRFAAADLRAMLTHRRAAFEQICDEKEGVWVGPVEADGEAAALLPLIQAGFVTAEADGRVFEALREHAAFNARVLNDEDLEAAIRVKGGKRVMEVLDTAVVELPEVPVDGVVEWLRVEAGSIETMWQQRFEEWIQTRSASDAATVERLRNLGLELTHAGIDGLRHRRPPRPRRHCRAYYRLATRCLFLPACIGSDSHRLDIRPRLYALGPIAGVHAAARMDHPHRSVPLNVEVAVGNARGASVGQTRCQVALHRAQVQRVLARCLVRAPHLVSARRGRGESRPRHKRVDGAYAQGGLGWFQVVECFE